MCIRDSVYTVSYDLNGGTTSDDSLYANASVEEGDTVTLPAAPAKDGMVFTGWSDGTTLYQPGETYTLSARDVTFTAQWQPTYGITVTVREPKPDDSGEMQPVSGAVVSLRCV